MAGMATPPMFSDRSASICSERGLPNSTYNVDNAVGTKQSICWALALWIMVTYVFGKRQRRSLPDSFQIKKERK